MIFTRLKPGRVGSNCYILIEDGEALVVDPGVQSEQIITLIEEHKAKLKVILLTHCHFDHMIGLERLRALNPEAQVMVHADDAELMSDGHKNAFYVFFEKDHDFGKPDKLLIEGDSISIGGAHIRTIHTPGHTKGSSCFSCGNILFTGDTLFAEGYGRCDLYSGNAQRLNSSLTKLMHLSAKNPKIVIYPGHGERTALVTALNKIFTKAD